MNDLPEGIRRLEQALEQATAVDDPVEAAECCAHLALAYFWHAKINQSARVTLQRLALARRTYDPYQLRHVYAWLAVTSLCRGRSAEGARWLDQAQANVEHLASPEPRAFLHFVRGARAYFYGEYVTAEAEVTAALAVYRAIGSGALLWYLGWLPLILVALGREAEARASLAELEALVGALPAGSLVAAAPQTYGAMATLALNDRERLPHYYAQLAVFAGQFHSFLIDRLLGEIATREHNIAAALVHLAAAETTARRENLTWELGRTLEARAALAQAQGTKGQSLLDEAAGVYRRSGYGADERRLAERLPARPGTEAKARPGSSRYPAGLSAREVDVLRLIAAGKSNRAIARTLVISERTVANHVASILGKISADNRAAAAAFAIRHGLID